jgi:peptidoglycan L-alanyl-D-glutamate endopeptidase CwlK
MDRVSEAKLGLVNPQLADRIRRMYDILSSEDIIFQVTESLRTWQEQAMLYAQGRTKPGVVVTNAQPGHSWHNFGLAVDLVPLTQFPAKPDWNRDHPVWKRLIAVGQEVGLVEGANFRTFPDWPHFQLTGHLPISPDEGTRQVFQHTGLVGVWEHAGLIGADDWLSGQVNV